MACHTCCLHTQQWYQGQIWALEMEDVGSSPSSVTSHLLNLSEVT